MQRFDEMYTRLPYEFFSQGEQVRVVAPDSLRAAVRKRPLVEPEMPAPATRRAEPDAAPARKLFGRRGA